MSKTFSLESLAEEAGAGETVNPPAPTPAPPAPPADNTTPPAPPSNERGEDYVNLDTWAEPKGEDARPSDETRTPDDDGNYKHRFNVLQGKYNAEVPRLQARIRELESAQQQGDTAALRAQVAALESRIAALSSAPTPAPAGTPPPTPDTTDDDLDFEFGPEGAAAIRAANARADSLQTKVASIETTLASQQKADFQKSLMEQLGDARTAFQDPDWPAFAAKANPLSVGKTFNDTMHEADAARESAPIINIVKQFIAEKAAAAPAAPSPDPFDELATPNRVTASGTPQAGAQRFRANDLQLMMAKWQRGEKTWAELQQFETAFNAAQAAGRVDP